MIRVDGNRQALELTCGSCGATSRILLGRLRDRPVCGRCRAALAASAPLEVTDASFDALVGSAALPVLVDFWAPWCAPCRAVAPQLEQVARQAAGRVLVAKLNTDDNPAIAGRFGIRSIPTLMIFDGGQQVVRRSGALSAEQIMALLPG